MRQSLETHDENREVKVHGSAADSWSKTNPNRLGQDEKTEFDFQQDEGKPHYSGEAVRRQT